MLSLLHRARWQLPTGLFLVGLLLLACEQRPAAQERPAGPKRARVVSLSPNTTEAMFAIGAGPLLVGRSQQCDYPPQARKLRSVGGFANPDIETVLSLRPTLVIGSRGPSGPVLVERLGGEGIATFFPPTTTVREIGAMLLALGKKLGHEKQARAAKSAIDVRLEQIRFWASSRPRVSVVVVFDANPLFVAGPGGFVNELLALAGGTNLIKSGGAYPTIDVERLLSLEPDVIIDAVNVSIDPAKPSQLPKMPGWATLGAVRRGRVRRLLSSTALRPGPRIAEGLAAVVRALHNEAPPPMSPGHSR